MPTYEYECGKCGFCFEKFQSMSDEPLKKCPKCRCKVKRLVGRGAGIIFKGSGFYETDYKRKTGGGGDSGAGKSGASPSKSSEPKSTESKSTETKAPESKNKATSAKKE